MKYKTSFFLFSILYVFLSVTVFAQNGIIKSYYADRTLRAAISYVNDIYDGTSYWYYPNGNLKKEITYSNGIVQGWVREYYESGLLHEEYYVDNGVRDGVSKSYYANGGIKQVLNYEKGRLIKTVNIAFDPYFKPSVEDYKSGNRQQQNVTKKKEYFCDADICPAPIGGMEAIYSKIVYPEHAKIYGVEGEVIIVASIDKTGKVTNTKLVKGIGLGCDEAAEEAIRKTDFLPGQTKGQLVASNVTLNIKFELKGDERSAMTSQKRLQEETGDLTSNQQPQQDSSENAPSMEEQKTDTTAQQTVMSDNTGIQQNEKPLKPDYIESDLEDYPEPKGGMEAILRNMELPPGAIYAKVKGTAVIEATIDEYGNVVKAKIISGPGYGSEEAAEVALVKTEFKPGSKHNILVRTNIKIKIPIDATKK